MAKAQKGDLIRITNPVGVGNAYERTYNTGHILEVTGRGGDNDRGVYTKELGQKLIFDSEYRIHRKAGEEDDVNSTHLEPSKWSDTQENLIRLACSELADLLVRKNHDYGDSFSQQYGKYGLMSALIRMDDKMRRLETLQGGQQAEVAESISDTLLDLAGYALLSYVEEVKRGIGR